MLHAWEQFIIGQTGWVNTSTACLCVQQLCCDTQQMSECPVQEHPDLQSWRALNEKEGPLLVTIGSLVCVLTRFVSAIELSRSSEVRGDAMSMLSGSLWCPRGEESCSVICVSQRCSMTNQVWPLIDKSGALQFLSIIHLYLYVRMCVFVLKIIVQLAQPGKWDRFCSVQKLADWLQYIWTCLIYERTLL